jgi:hypothetical protein
MYLEDGYFDQPPSQEGSEDKTEKSPLGDSSGHLFSMYSKIVEKEDNAVAEQWQKDGDGIIIFVSAQVKFLCRCVRQQEVYRQVYSLRSSLHSSH